MKKTTSNKTLLSQYETISSNTKRLLYTSRGAGSPSMKETFRIIY